MNFSYRFKFARQTLVFITGLMACFLLSTAQADVAADIEKVREKASKMFRGVGDATIVESPAKNVYRIGFDTGGFAFAYVDGDFVLLGDSYNVEELVNLTEKATNERMIAAIDEVPTSKMIVYGPKDAKRHITVFTDIDCGFCRKLHNEVPALNEAGVQVRYLAYPRAGINSGSYNKYVSVWCNDDQQQSLTDAKNGKSVPAATCDNPIAETHGVAKSIGIRGTPTVVLDNGSVNPGYAPAADLIKQLGLSEEG